MGKPTYVFELYRKISSMKDVNNVQISLRENNKMCINTKRENFKCIHLEDKTYASL